MTSQSEVERKRIINMGSTLRAHSLNQRTIRYGLQGEERLGMARRVKMTRRLEKRRLQTDIKGALHTSVNAAFNGEASISDVVTIAGYIEGMEELVERRVNEENGTDISITLVDFTR